ncbi:gp214 [Sphingomonas phage PAU]|uniref:gp214 n=1 Tax=Sphingomonas phage PAU TaxID=1150991 RepID=UPI0002573374|nr:gp214 [Sphingomonas phage PAU]AFF28212.1 gp214 [Sphingomonas phage PAU]
MNKYDFNWVRDESLDTYDGYYHAYIVTRKFGNVKARLGINLDPYMNCYVSLSSGRKRKQLSIYEDKPEKNSCGIEILIWTKEAMLDFPIWFNDRHINKLNSMLVTGSDTRRFKIYKRYLIPHGFYTQKQHDGGIYLFKKL